MLSCEHGGMPMSELAFSQVMTNIDSFSYVQKLTLLHALKKSISLPHFFSKKRSSSKIADSLVGILSTNDNSDISINDVREERLKKYESLH